MFKSTLKKISTVTLLFLALAVFLAPVPAAQAAGSEPDMKSLDLQIWSEYDEPRVLHILTGSLVNTTGKEYSGTVKFNIPKGAEIKMACELINGTQHSCQPYEIADKGDYAELTWKMTKKLTPGEEYPFWLEYYYNPIQGKVDKTIDYTFKPSYNINQLKVTFKEPLKATNFKSTPQAVSTGKDGENFTTHYYDFQQVTPDKPVNFKFSYTRAESEPSVKKPENPGGADAKPASEPLGTSVWKKPEVLIPSILLVIVLVVFIFYAMNNSNKQAPAERIERIQRQSSSKGAKPAAGSNPKLAREKKKIRQMLLDGEISEETYRELIAELEADYA